MQHEAHGAMDGSNKNQACHPAEVGKLVLEVAAVLAVQLDSGYK